MKISIITRHAIANYGSLLQSIATEKLFHKFDFKTEIINYIPESEKIENIVDSYINNSNFWNKNFITRCMYKLLQSKNIFDMNKIFSLYQRKYLNLSEKEYHSKEELIKDKPKTNIFCTGSDQVWGPIGDKKYDDNYFLDFIDKDDIAISYAASFGREVIEPELKSKLYQLVNKYDGLLVREDSAVEILKRVNIKNAEQVMDPTLLLNSDDWSNICVDEKLINEDYILIYQLHHNRKMDEYAKRIAKITGKKLVRINVSRYFKYKSGKFVYLPSPGEFLSYLKFADIVLTDSFHGTCFSIIYNKEFIDILPEVTETRILSILKVFGLENRLVKNYSDTSVLNEKIDYNKVNLKLKNMQQDSLNKLKNVLIKCGVKNGK